MQLNKTTPVIYPKFHNTNINQTQKELNIDYNPHETTIYQSDDLDRVSLYLDNLCIISNFNTLTNLDHYISFITENIN